MTASTVSSLDKTVQQTNNWLDQLGQDLQCDSRQAYRALSAVLHSLRDRVTVEEASDFGAQLPMLVRGIYYEGFNPAQQPTEEADEAEFLDRISQEFQDAQGVDAKRAAEGVFRLLATYCTAGQVRHVRSHLPKEIQQLWPE